MNVVSLFDGISCAKVALERQGFKIKNYYASEIDAHAIAVSLANHPEIKHVGGVQNVNKENFPHIFNSKIDLLIGGSPCQDLSVAKKQREGLKGKRSGLFYEYVRILKELKPKYFILENVASMPKEAKDEITKELGVEPIMIDAALVSAQRRKRLFWTNIPNILQPIDRKIMSWNIIEDMNEKEKVYQYRRTYWREIESGKIPTLTANMGTGGNNVPFVKIQEATKKGFAVAYPGDAVDTSFPTSKTRRGRVGSKIKNVMTSSTGIKIFNGEKLRPLTEVEIERAFSLPDNYTVTVSRSARRKSLGNAFNVEVVSHILSYLPKE